MKIIKFYESEGTLKLRADNLEDLWAIQRIIFKDDFVKSETKRRFRPEEGDIGELKDVVIKIKVEKTELDKAASRLRITGKIVEGRPVEYIKKNSYHTLNIAPGDEFYITKGAWHDYLINVLKNAVQDSKRPRLGIIVVDDEKALSAYVLGYGIQFGKELYSHLSKRLSPKDFNEMQKKYFENVVDIIAGMRVDTVLVAGPGFTKDDIKKHMEDSGRMSKLGKNLVFESVSNSERSGVYELIKSEAVERILQKERIRLEFVLMEQFLKGLEIQKSVYGIENVRKALELHAITAMIVNDSVLGLEEIKTLLNLAENDRVNIEVFNSNDEVGEQLHAFKDIAAMY